jgi:hypothetical protein
MKFLSSPLVRSAMGLTLAPIVGGAIGSLAYVAVSPLLYPQNDFGHPLVSALQALASGAVIGGILGIIPSLVVGWPLHLLLRRMRTTHLAVYIVLGAVLAVPTTVLGLLMLLPEWLGGVHPTSESLLLLGACGGAGGLIFWLIRRPDRDWKPLASVNETKP